MGVIAAAVLYAMLLEAAPLHVVRAPDPRCPKAAVARAGAERAARRELERRLESRAVKDPVSRVAKARVRYGSDGGVEMWLEVYTAPGATGATWTITYENQASQASRQATYAHPANAESVGQMMPVALQAGDTGIKSPTSFQCTVSSGTAGDIGVTLLRRLGTIPITTGGLNFDAFQLALPRVLDDACLAFMVCCSTTSTGIIIGSAAVTQIVP